MRFCSWMLAGTIAVTAACDSTTGVVLVITAGQGLADANLEAPIELYLYDDTQLAEPIGLTRFRRIEPTSLGGDILPIDTDDSDLENDGYRVFIPLAPGQRLRGVLVAGTAVQSIGTPQFFEGSAAFEVSAPASGVGEWPVVLRRSSPSTLTGAFSTMRADRSICVGLMQDGGVQKLIIPGRDSEALDLDCDGIAMPPETCSADPNQIDPFVPDDQILPDEPVDLDGDGFATCVCGGPTLCDCNDQVPQIRPNAEVLTCNPLIDSQDLDCNPNTLNPTEILPVPCALFDDGTASHLIGVSDCNGTCKPGVSLQRAVGGTPIGTCNYDSSTCELPNTPYLLALQTPQEEFSLDILLAGNRPGAERPDSGLPCVVRVWRRPNDAEIMMLGDGAPDPALPQQWSLETCNTVLTPAAADGVLEFAIVITVHQDNKDWAVLWSFTAMPAVPGWVAAQPSALL